MGPRCSASRSHERRRREDPEWDAAIRAAEAELPDYGDPVAVQRYITRQQERAERVLERLQAALARGAGESAEGLDATTGGDRERAAPA